MKSFPPSPAGPYTPNKRKTPNLKNKRNSRTTPSRSRRRYDPQRRLEVATTRRKGACARCREKKVRCFPAQHKSSAGGTLQTSSDTLSNLCEGPEGNDWTCFTNSGNNDKNETGGHPLGLEGCVKAAREYLKVAQSFTEEFTCFVESWETAQKHPIGSQSSNEQPGIPQADDLSLSDGSPQSSHNSSPVVGGGNIESDSRPIQADPQNNGDIFKDQDFFSTISKPATRSETLLSTKDQSRPLRENSDLVKRPIHQLPREEVRSLPRKRRRSRLRGENEPWVALAPEETSHHHRRNQSARPQNHIDEGIFDEQESHSTTLQQNYLWSTDYSPAPLSNRSNLPSPIAKEIFPGFSGTMLPSSFNTNICRTGPSKHLSLPITDPFSKVMSRQDLAQPIESFQHAAADTNTETYDSIRESQFHLGLAFDQELHQDSNDPFVSSLTVPAAPTMGLNEATSNPLIAPSGPNSHSTRQNSTQQSSIFNSNLTYQLPSNKISFQTPSSSLRILSLGSTPISSVSRGAVPVTPQDLAYTPTRKHSEQWQRLGTFRSPDKAHEIAEDWSFEDLDAML